MDFVYCFISIHKAILWSLAALMCYCQHDRSTVRRHMHCAIVEHVSKNPVCPAPVVVRVEAESLHARPTVVLEKPHLNIASRPRPRLHLLRHLAIVPASTNLHVPTEPYGDVVSLLW
jgi:hypothetical protein